MKQLSNGGHNGFRLSLEAGGHTKWRSPAGILYTSGSIEGHRLSHILTHSVPNYKSGSHSVFDLARGELLPLLDAAWGKPRLPAYKKDGTLDTGAFLADMERITGINGESHIRIAFSGSEITLAYPFIP